MITLDEWSSDGLQELKDAAISAKADSEDEFAFLFGKTATLYTSQQRALEVCLEALGVSLYKTPVILSVACSPDICAAVVRSGGTPVLLDVKLDQWMNEEDLAEATGELKEAVVIFDRPFGRPIPASQLRAAGNAVTIQISPVAPFEDQEIIQATTFAIYDLAPAVHRGAVLYCKFEDQQQVIKQVKSGNLGVNDVLSPFEARLGKIRYSNIDFVKARATAVAALGTLYKVECQAAGIVSLLHHEEVTRFFPVYVKDAQLAQVHLASYNIASCVCFSGLHHMPELALRFQGGEVPAYPNADKLHNRVLCLPCHLGVTPKSVLKIISVLADLKKS